MKKRTSAVVLLLVGLLLMGSFSFAGYETPGPKTGPQSVVVIKK